MDGWRDRMGVDERMFDACWCTYRPYRVSQGFPGKSGLEGPQGPVGMYVSDASLQALQNTRHTLHCRLCARPRHAEHNASTVDTRSQDKHTNNNHQGTSGSVVETMNTFSSWKWAEVKAYSIFCCDRGVDKQTDGLIFQDASRWSLVNRYAIHIVIISNSSQIQSIIMTMDRVFVTAVQIVNWIDYFFHLWLVTCPCLYKMIHFLSVLCSFVDPFITRLKQT